ncbi:4-hydroxy-3-methylbut-2-en-1-yl diphosphate synthase [Pedobacter psychrotolerans]|uniref:4-hydroxy-3-methylbut-2-en-1-yl diphosphate synthase (flavodoxin) n=1 Tax=Pedobacter psychrotolerans TaxID=1843235 RepID=A0A4R2HNC7_9SPHI|nr:(E)-4-hydroxy-3-methylbut-2-enyl-diphosphate synthase [Pedobacter psychrotolerans]TCO30634.1 4-hydroxy-3-methylbut-2-en-1-yl diphosphate synthase [Pedobacter psychrotolerans]GGE68707.1 4-hydroxy-3-methylbut-2-en-1-yl diphosphate synthase (flavodoxin) [Pedobacter psychrotolerans]
MENLSVKHELGGGYCNSLTQYSRFLTREVKIGDIALGGHNPIRIQSMTTTDTMDTIGTVEQTIRMVESGCEYVRITAPSIKEAENLANIKKELRFRGYDVPLIADIHFTPNAAEMAARIVEKVRVNPGNYADKKKFENLEYTQDAYTAELERINKKFIPLIKICKEYGTAMRIGTNHGSLSDRIMSHYGDTPRGMVESAMEFIRMCEAENYYNLVISMKASNTQVMVQAYRLLVETMVKEGMNYPLHLGVTEAGDGEDGRIKSAVGIGTLLEDGLGDTIRVSLTEDPEFEAPVAKALADRYVKRSLEFEARSSESSIILPTLNTQLPTYSPYAYSRRITQSVQHIGDHHHPLVMIDVSKENLKDPYFLSSVGYNYSAGLDKYNLADQACDLVFLGDNLPSFSFPGNLKQIYNYNTWLNLSDKNNCHPLFSLEEFSRAEVKDEFLNFVRIDASQQTSLTTTPLNNVVLILETSAQHGMAEQRAFFVALQNRNIQIPVIIRRSYENLDADTLMLYAATDFGALFTDGFGDGIWMDAQGQDLVLINSTSFGILQATRTRISKTEYISCPSCGRTLFDLQETTQLIRSRTDHLKGLKIGIMGCIVNGPGEMADADYGYVGTGPDKITLYRGQEVVKKNVTTAFALDELIEIIKNDGNWVEKV